MGYNITVDRGNGNNVLNVQNTPTVSVNAAQRPIVSVNTPAIQGVPGIGVKGDKGDKGDTGPSYDGEDLPDFSLWFDNKLI